MHSFRLAIYFFILWLSLIHLTSCGTIKSVVPGMGNDSPPGAAAGEKLHFKVTPEEAIAILGEVAPENGWRLVSTGDQFDIHGLRGKYFRLETDRFLGGRKSVDGVFFSEPEGTYVIVGKSDIGLPEPLTAPFMAAVEARTKTAGGP